jgi:hypothetical protein
MVNFAVLVSPLPVNVAIVTFSGADRSGMAT